MPARAMMATRLIAKMASTAPFCCLAERKSFISALLVFTVRPAIRLLVVSIHSNSLNIRYDFEIYVVNNSLLLVKNYINHDG
jgi:hypothetical protein